MFNFGMFLCFLLHGYCSHHNVMMLGSKDVCAENFFNCF